jgi:hypothetical protein
MPRDTTVRASDFARNFAKYQDEAISAKIISVTSHGRIVGAYLSAEELARYQALKRRAGEALRVGELDDDTVAAIEAAEYGVEPK